MRIKRAAVFLLTLALCALLAACGSGSNSGKYSDITPDKDGIVTISTAEISTNARFYNYIKDGVTVQLVALRDKSGSAHIAFNTCQSCSPSPKAYYTQTGSVLQCANCGFTFAPEQVGITQGGCNPWPIEGVSIGEDSITLPAASLDSMTTVFASWAGATK